jgi:PAS domain S-box-containing protein
MRDTEKTKEQLLNEIRMLRQQTSKLEQAQLVYRLAEEALRESEMKFRSVAHSAVDAIITADSNDTIVFWNQGAENIFRYSEKEILGQPIATIIPTRYRAAHSQGLKRFIETGETHILGRTVELIGLRKGDEEFPLELSVSSWTTHEGVFFSGIIRDISDRKEAQRQLENSTLEARQRTEELESLIQMVAHDLKSPVIVIAGMVRLLKGQIAKICPDAGADRILDQLRGSAESLEKFLKDLLDGLAATQSPQIEEEVHLEEIIDEVVRRHRELIDETGTAIEVILDRPVPPVVGDPRRIEQVVDNLVANALRHMDRPSGATVCIEVITYDDSDFIVTKVSDNGVGIPPEHHTRIFDRFFRVPSPSGLKGGTGLGLSIVKKIVESHGGRIWVASEAGRGATFSFTMRKAAGRGINNERGHRK